MPSTSVLWRAGRIAGWILVAALAVAVLGRAAGYAAAVHSHADMAAPLAMADLLDRYDGAAAMTGNYGWWNGLWIVQALEEVPGGTLGASYLPLVGTLLAIAALTWQAARLFGARAAVAVPLVAGAVGPTTWVLDAAWSARAPSWWGMVALGIVLVGWATRAPAETRTRDRALLALVVLWCGAALSGDALAWTSIVAPALGLAAALVVVRRPRAALVPAGSALAIALSSLAVRAVAEGRGYLQRPSPVELTPFDEAQAGTGNVVVGLEAVWRGPQGSTVGAAAGYLGALLVVVAVAAGVAWLVAVATRAWGAARDTGGPLPADRGRAATGRTAWAAYWATMAVGTTVAFVFSGASVVDGQPVARYLYGVPFAAGALLALLAGWTRPRGAVLVPAALLAALAVVGLARHAPPRTPEARGSALPQVEAIARQERVTRGYASYWSAYPMTVRSGFRLQVDPVGECPGPAGRGLCPMYLHYVDRAYEPRRGIRSFLLVDTGAGSRPGAPEWVTAPPDGVQPVRTHVVAPGLQMLIYDHDLAADLQPRVGTGDPLRHRD